MMTNRIAIVEDEPDLREMLTDILEGHGYSVVGIARPENVYNIRQDLHPNLFLLDLMLPGMTGMELADQLRNKLGYHATPMIAMSASRLMLEVAWQSNLFQDTLLKPFDMSTLIERVERCKAATAQAS